MPAEAPRPSRRNLCWSWRPPSEGQQHHGPGGGRAPGPWGIRHSNDTHDQDGSCDAATNGPSPAAPALGRAPRAHLPTEATRQAPSRRCLGGEVPCSQRGRDARCTARGKLQAHLRITHERHARWRVGRMGLHNPASPPRSESRIPSLPAEKLFPCVWSFQSRSTLEYGTTGTAVVFPGRIRVSNKQRSQKQNATATNRRGFVAVVEDTKLF